MTGLIDAIHQHGQVVRGEASMLRGKARALEVIGLLDLAETLFQAAEMLEGSFQALRDNFGKDLQRQSDESANMLGLTMAAAVAVFTREGSPRE